MLKTLAALLQGLRLKQAIKNTFLFAGLIFSERLFHYPDNLQVLAGFGLFCLISWAVYLFNDIQDRELDRLHPVKRFRPVASGRLSVPAAAVASALLGSGGLVGAALLSREFGLTCLVYAGLNLAYSRILKNVILLDIMTVSAGFFLRVIAGTQIIHVAVSHWLLVCGIFLSLFLGFCKRRAELQSSDSASRPILREYNLQFLDQLIAALTAATILSYILYTISPETVAKFGTDDLLLTSPFVLYGIFRYLFLIYVRSRGEDTALELFTDLPMLLAGAGWLAATAIVIYL